MPFVIVPLMPVFQWLALNRAECFSLEAALDQVINRYAIERASRAVPVIDLVIF